MSKDRPSNSREHINRAHKAMGIVSNIQDFCDNLENIREVTEQDKDNPDLEPHHFLEPLGDGKRYRNFVYSDFIVAVKNPLRPESVAILSQFCLHCRSWPSRETWRYVEEFLTNYEITKLNINTNNTDNTSSNESD